MQNGSCCAYRCNFHLSPRFFWDLTDKIDSAISIVKWDVMPEGSHTAIVRQKQAMIEGALLPLQSEPCLAFQYQLNNLHLLAIVCLWMCMCV